jgi:serine/threonine-protein kinase
MIGQNIELARQYLTDMHFAVNEIFEFNETFNENMIFATDPEAGTIVESPEGEPIGITVFVSKGLQTYDMPDLIGLTEDKAISILSGIGLAVPEVIYEFNTDQPVDRIFAQNPPALSKVNKTTPMTLYVSMGENPEGIIPFVIGMNEEEALLSLEDSGFENVTVVIEESEDEIDLVFAQVPESGTAYEKTLEVIIKISKGIEVPDVIGMDKLDAVEMLEGLGFDVTVVPDPSYTGSVISQTPESYTYLNYGSQVAIEIEGDTEGTEPTGPEEEPEETTETTGPT